jgi:hypothetical protein
MVLGSSEQGDKASGSTKSREFPEKLRDYLLPEKEPLPRI